VLYTRCVFDRVEVLRRLRLLIDRRTGREDQVLNPEDHVEADRLLRDVDRTDIARDVLDDADRANYTEYRISEKELVVRRAEATIERLEDRRVARAWPLEGDLEHANDVLPLLELDCQNR